MIKNVQGCKSYMMQNGLCADISCLEPISALGATWGRVLPAHRTEDRLIWRVSRSRRAQRVGYFYIQSGEREGVRISQGNSTSCLRRSEFTHACTHTETSHRVSVRVHTRVHTHGDQASCVRGTVCRNSIPAFSPCLTRFLRRCYRISISRRASTVSRNRYSPEDMWVLFCYFAA